MQLDYKSSFLRFLKTLCHGWRMGCDYDFRFFRFFFLEKVLLSICCFVELSKTENSIVACDFILLFSMKKIKKNLIEKVGTRTLQIQASNFFENNLNQRFVGTFSSFMFFFCFFFSRHFGTWVHVSLSIFVFFFFEIGI